MNYRALKALLRTSIVITLFTSMSLLAQSAATFEVGTAALPIITTATATTPSPFTRISFGREFAPGTIPNVFPMTPEFGAGAADDPCTIRIRNIDNTGFDAACLEPINEDRDSPAVSFDYVAMINGTLNVPIVGSANTVRFESLCSLVTTQQFGPNCNNCALLGGQVQGFTPINFLTAFNNPPALLTQIVSTNNTFVGGAGIPAGEPEFLEASVQTASLTAANFDWTIDRMEAGNGTISSGETLCYLAVERDGCQELDFSSLDGPASVDFTAVFGGNVDGHDNGASAGEGATFPAGCFSSTPITIGNARSRRGNNGGFLRRVSQNSAAVIFTFDEDRVSDAERRHIDEEVSAIAFSSTFTTPVTLSKAKVTQRGRKARFDWETGSETFHLGFHLWGETLSGWEQLNKRLILGAQTDTAQTNRYTRTIKLDRRQLNEVQRFGISTIDNTGFEEFYGPFELDTEYGEDANNEAVDWSTTRATFEQRMRNRGFTKKNNRWRKVSNKAKQRLVSKQLGEDAQILNFEFDTNGIHRVPATSILELSPNWAGVPLSELAVTLNGVAVSRDIISDDDLFSIDDQIIFNVRKPNGSDAVYLNNYVYQLRLDRIRAQDASYFDGSIDANSSNVNVALQTAGLVSVIATKNNTYSGGIEADSPWYDRRLLSRGTPTSANYTIDFTRPIALDSSAILDVTLFGGIDLDGDVDDHHVQISVNGTTVDDVRFDGLSRYSNRLELSPGVLTQSNNTVSVTIVGDTGLFADLILVDEVVLSAPQELQNRASYDFSTANKEGAYRAVLDNASSALVYAYTSDGALSQVGVSSDENTVSFVTLPSLDTLRSDLRFTVSQLTDLPQAKLIEPAEINLIHSNVGDLLLVAHPNFLGQELEDYAQFKRQHGYTVTIVDWLELVETYGHGNHTPGALDNFLARAYPSETSTADLLSNVLIVGGHTYDYLGHQNDDIVNFIPTHYRKVGIHDFTPSDNVFADLDNDQIPDIAIGRWPVRTQEDLSIIIKKTKDWQANRDGSAYQDALLIAQANDSSNLNFTKQLDIHLGIPLSSLDDFDTISRISMQELSASEVDNPIQAARDSIEAKINDGLELLSFGGHGSYGSWGFQGVVNTNFVKNLSNQGKPTVVMPMACYTSNYEHPSVNTLAHQWLFAGDTGAAAIHGASVLGEYRENAVFAERYINNTASSKTLGEAIFKAKNEMASGNEMLHNWAYLGDPTLPLR